MPHSTVYAYRLRENDVLDSIRSHHYNCAGISPRSYRPFAIGSVRRGPVSRAKWGVVELCLTVLRFAESPHKSLRGGSMPIRKQGTTATASFLVPAVPSHPVFPRRRAWSVTAGCHVLRRFRVYAS